MGERERERKGGGRGGEGGKGGVVTRLDYILMQISLKRQAFIQSSLSSLQKTTYKIHLVCLNCV